jgi:hypothetical protein
MDTDEPATTKKKKSRGARLSKSEREARRDARLAAAEDDAAGGELLAERLARLRSLVESGSWDAAATLGAESMPLAVALVRALLPTDRLRQLTHVARKLATAVGAPPLRSLVDEAAAQGRCREAAALARGLGLASAEEVFGFGGLHDLALGCFERGALAEGAEILGTDLPLQLGARADSKVAPNLC